MMVRAKFTINNKLRQINKQIYAIQAQPFFSRYRQRKKLKFLNGQSWALAWALNKIDHDTRGDHATRKKNY